VVALPLLSACFTYVPAELETVPPGDEVRVYLTRRALAELPEEFAPGGSYVAGSFAGQGEDSLRVRVPVSARQPGFLSMDLRQEVHVPASEVLQIERRQFSYSRTALLVAGAAGGATAIIAFITSSLGEGGAGDENLDVTLIPLFSIPIP